MIYERSEFVEENPENEKYPLKTIEKVSSLDKTVTKYIGRVSLGIQTPMGMSTIPVSFEIEAASIEEAFQKFETRAEEEVARTRDELQEQLQEVRRKSQSRIVTPGELPAGGLGNLGQPGGILQL